MDDMRNEDRKEEQTETEIEWKDRAPSPMMRWLIIVDVLFFAAALFAGGFAYEQGTAASNLMTQNQSLHTMIDQMRAQIDTLTAKMNQMATAPPPQAPPAAAPVTKRPASANTAAQDRRIKQVQSELDDQQKQLQQTQEQLESAKADLQGQVGSTRDELNGSIAKTHDELVTLEQRGARRYFEFDLSKSKGFQHEGPVQISLRKVDSKHQSYDLVMLVDDHQLMKKKVDLYEPISLDESDQPEPVQVVVNKIDKDHIHGYVSAPRFTESQLTSSSARPSTDGASRQLSTPSPNSPSDPTSNPSASATSSTAQQSPSE